MAQNLPKRVLFASPWWHEQVVNGTVRHAAAHGWHLDLRTCLGGRLPEAWDGDGVITQFGVDLDHLQRLIADSGCPAVSYNTNHPELDIPRVSMDSAAAGRLAAEHLLERGFRSFAFFSNGMSRATGQARRASFTQTLEQAGHAVTPLLWHEQHDRQAKQETDHRDTWAARQAWLRDELARLDKPVAVCCINDEAATEVIEACLAQSIAVPGQVAVLGMLDMALFRHSTGVALSSVVMDFDAITRAGCDLLDRMMRGEPAPDGPTLFAPLGVAARQSTDTYAAHSPAVSRAVAFMLEHFAEPIGTDEITQAAGVSRATLFNAFNADGGQTPGTVLLRIRLEKAKRLLIHTDAKVYDVADQCGFGVPVNLHRAFKQHLGMSPNQYRKANRQYATGSAH